MILRKIPVHILACLVISILVQSVFSSNSKSNKGKSKAKISSSFSSAHQYGSLTLKPSKPDPHFEILDEQRSYKGYYRSTLREGRSGSEEVKPSKLKEVSSSSTKKGCCRRKDKKAASSSSSSFSRGTPSSNSYENQAQLTFSKKSTERTHPKFSSSQLISGDAGMSNTFKAHTQQSNIGRDGWRILMGPSVSPEDDDYSYKSHDDDSVIRRTFTSLTQGDGEAHPRTITKYPIRSKTKSGKTLATSLKYASMDDFPSLKKITGTINGKGQKVKPNQVPKEMFEHKHTTVTRRYPSKSSSDQNKPSRSEKKVKMSTNLKQQQYSNQMKSTDNHNKRFFSSKENSLNAFNPSPVMTLDTKKLVLEPVSGETDESRFDRLFRTSDEDLITEDNSNDSQKKSSFQTKTALNVREYSPLISVSTSMKYPDQKEQGGIITAASSEDIPQLLHNPLDPVTSLNMPLPLQHPIHPDDHDHDHPHEDGHEHDLPHDGLKNGIFDDHIVPPQPPHPLLSAPHLNFPPPGSTPYGRILAHGQSSASRIPPNPAGNFGAGSSSGSLILPPFRPIPLRSSEFENIYFQDLSSGYHKFAVDTNHSPHPTDSLPDPANIHPVPFPHPHHYSDHADPHHPHNLPLALPLHAHPIHHHPPHHHPHPPHHSHPHPHHHDHHHHRHPHILPPPHPFPPLPHIRKPLGVPLEIESGRKAPPPGSAVELGKHDLPHSPPPPPPGVDPDHPAIQHVLKNPHNLLLDGHFIEPTDGSHIQETTKHYLQYSVHKSSLVPLDKRLVYLAMIFSWMFWITAFYTYYRWTVNGNKGSKFVLSVPNDGENPQVVTAR